MVRTVATSTLGHWMQMKSSNMKWMTNFGRNIAGESNEYMTKVKRRQYDQCPQHMGSIAGALHDRDCQMQKRRAGNNGRRRTRKLMTVYITAYIQELMWIACTSRESRGLANIQDSVNMEQQSLSIARRNCWRNQGRKRADWLERRDWHQAQDRITRISGWRNRFLMATFTYNIFVQSEPKSRATVFDSSDL